MLLALAPERGLELEVEVDGCVDMDEARIADLLALELQLESDPPCARLRVAVTCGDDGARIEISDPLTDKVLSRRMALPAEDDAGRERILALAASRLIVASWLELMIREPEPEPAPAPEPEPPIVREARAVAERHIAPPPEPRSTLTLAVQEGASVRALLGEPIYMVHTDVALRGRLAGGWGLAGGVGYRQGTRQTRLGDAVVAIVDGSLRVPWRHDFDAPVAVSLGPGLSLEWHHLAGRPDDPVTPHARYYGLAARADAELTLTLQTRALELGIAWRLGYAFAAPVARVDDRAITARGLSLDVALVAAVDLGPCQRR